MEKLTSILAVVRDARKERALLDKARTLALRFQARLEISAESLSKRPPGPGVDLVISSDPLNAKYCNVPLLVARERPWGMEPRFAAAVDITNRDAESLARAILHTAGFFGLGFEAWIDVLYCEREQSDETARLERAVRLARLVRENHVGGERLQVYDGDPARVLPPLIRARRYDVLIVGDGEVTDALAKAGDGDVLLVPLPATPISAKEPGFSLPAAPASGPGVRAN